MGVFILNTVSYGVKPGFHPTQRTHARNENKKVRNKRSWRKRRKRRNDQNARI